MAAVLSDRGVRLPKMLAGDGSFLVHTVPFLPLGVARNLGGCPRFWRFSVLGSVVELVETSDARISDAGSSLLMMVIGSGVVRVLSVRKDSRAGGSGAKSVRGGV